MATKLSSSIGSVSGEVGFTATNLEKMKNALDSYIDIAKKNVTISATVKDMAAALKGDAATKELLSYINGIDSACEKYIDELIKFKTTLSSVSTTYKSGDKFFNK